MKNSFFAFILMMLLLASCQGSPLALFGPTPTPFPDDFTGKAKIGDYELQISCQGSGEPTVILEHGQWGELQWNDSQIRKFSRITRTCTYVRLGKDTGDTFTAPRTAMDQVQDLHGLLEQTGVPKPYILVSVHLSSYNLILYADQYPQDVAGLVVVNTWYPTFYDYISKKIGPATADTPESWKEWIDFYADYKAKKVLLWDEHPEFIDQQASEAQVLKVASLKDVPLTIMESDIWTDVPVEEINQMGWESVQESTKDLCKLSSRCKMVAVPGTVWETIMDNEAVEKAIQETVDLAREE